MRSRIKVDEKTYSPEFRVEESIRQRSGLSASLTYGQHIANTVENLEEYGTRIGSQLVPATASQDDITVLIGDLYGHEE